MPRRPSKRPKGQDKRSSHKSSSFTKGASKMKKWDKPGDILLDEEDQFHASRSSVVPLNRDEFGSDDDRGDDEVFSLKNLEVSDSVEGNETVSDRSEDEEDILDVSTSRNASKGKARAKPSEPKPGKFASDSEEETWDKGKNAYYADNAAEIDSDDDEAMEMEEQEAKKLQNKTRENLTDEDFGLRDEVEIMPLEDLQKPLGVPTIKTQPPTDPVELRRFLERTNPEALALARDWGNVMDHLAKLESQIERLNVNNTEDRIDQGITHIYYQSLMAYASLISFYLYLRATPKYMAQPQLLRSHPIMKQMLTLKQGLNTIETLDMDSDSESEEYDFIMPGETVILSKEDEEYYLGKCAEFEALGLNLDNLSLPEIVIDRYRAQTAALGTKQKVSNQQGQPKKKRKIGGPKEPQAVPLFDLVEPDESTFRSSKIPMPLAAWGILDQSDAMDTFGEATSLQHADALDKNARKKSLRFHTSKIESGSARRRGARSAMGGDDDIPYRERKKQREERTAKEVERLAGRGGEDLNNEDPLEREDDGVVEDADEYYQLTKSISQKKKEKAKAEYDSEKLSQRMELAHIEETEGPRAVTRAILANKGLTPRRPKSVRNPRVKKRERYEKAKKKVASQKAVFKGGLAETGGYYGGEKSGITKVVKSVRLG